MFRKFFVGLVVICIVGIFTFAQDDKKQDDVKELEGVVCDKCLKKWNGELLEHIFKGHLQCTKCGESKHFKGCGHKEEIPTAKYCPKCASSEGVCALCGEKPKIDEKIACAKCLAKWSEKQIRHDAIHHYSKCAKCGENRESPCADGVTNPRYCLECALKEGVCPVCGEKVRIDEKKPDEKKPDEKKPDDKDLDKKIKELVKDLANDKPEVRQNAVKELKKIGKTALSYLEKILEESGDPEIKLNIENIIKTIKSRPVELVKAYVKEKLGDNYDCEGLLSDELVSKYILDCKFYFFIGGKPASKRLVAINEKDEKVFEVSKFNDLKPYLSAVKDKVEALEVACLVANLVGLCNKCEHINRKVSLKYFSVEKEGEGFLIKGLCPITSESYYKWKIEFDKEGKLKDMKTEMPEHKHSDDSNNR